MAIEAHTGRVYMFICTLFYLVAPLQHLSILHLTMQLQSHSQWVNCSTGVITRTTITPVLKKQHDQNEKKIVVEARMREFIDRKTPESTMKTHFANLI